MRKLKLKIIGKAPPELRFNETTEEAFQRAYEETGKRLYYGLDINSKKQGTLVNLYGIYMNGQDITQIIKEVHER